MVNEHRVSSADTARNIGTHAPSADWRAEPCPDCSGSGKCLICEGSGFITKQNELEQLVKTACTSCSGEGMCLACGGTGVEQPE